MSKPKTICKNCKWCVLRQASALAHRLDFRCGAVVHDAVTDPVTGEDLYQTHEAKFLTEEKHPSCADMNNGECPMYEEAE